MGSGRFAVAFSCVALAACHALAFVGHLVDDAYISFRYARMLAGGEGLVFNPGERVEGYTNFAWVMLCALAERVDVRSVAIAPILGLTLHVGLASLCLVAARRRAPELPTAGYWAATIVAGSAGLAFYSVTGLEGSLYTLSLTAAVVALLDGRFARFGVLAGLAFLTRPEAGLLIALGMAWLGLESGAGRLPRRAWLVAGASCALIVAPYLAFKWMYFGALLPNTLHAKRPDLLFGLAYVARQGWPALGLLGLVASHARARLDRFVLVVFVAYAGSVALTGGDWMPAGRLFVPYLPMLGILVDRPIAQAVHGGRRWLVLAAWLLFLVPQAVTTRTLSPASRATVGLDEGRAGVYAQLPQHGRGPIAAHDIGLLGYTLMDARIVDLGGLTDRRIGSGPGGYGGKRPPFDYLDGLAPEWVVIASPQPTNDPDGTPRILPRFEVERYLLASSWLRERYRHDGSYALDPRYHMHLFRRRGLPPER